MLYPIVHPFCVLSDHLVELHRAELDLMIERRTPSLSKLTR